MCDNGSVYGLHIWRCLLNLVREEFPACRRCHSFSAFHLNRKYFSQTNAIQDRTGSRHMYNTYSIYLLFLGMCRLDVMIFVHVWSNSGFNPPAADLQVLATCKVTVWQLLFKCEPNGIYFLHQWECAISKPPKPKILKFLFQKSSKLALDCAHSIVSFVLTNCQGKPSTVLMTKSNSVSKSVGFSWPF